MGTGKGILLAGVSLILGFYTLGIKGVDQMQSQQAENRVYGIQAESIAKSGMRFAINQLATSSFLFYGTRRTLTLFDGQLTYEVYINPFYPSQATVISTGTVKGNRVVISAVVTKLPSGTPPPGKRRAGNLWSIDKEYIQLQSI
jgi:hypothetical protein